MPPSPAHSPFVTGREGCGEDAGGGKRALKASFLLVYFRVELELMPSVSLNILISGSKTACRGSHENSGLYVGRAAKKFKCVVQGYISSQK